MSGSLNSFGKTASSLSRNPLGIVALFIVLVYGLAALVTTFASSLQTSERVPLIWFLVVFPVIVLGVFTWLVARHASKLYGPGDYRDEDNYVKMQIAVAASLAAATTRRSGVEPQDTDFSAVAEVVRVATSGEHRPRSSFNKEVLWVDDRPSNNIYERRAFESLGLSFALATSTDEALEFLRRNKFAAIISDMGRKEGPREGYVLLDQIRSQGDTTPFFIYAGSNKPEHKLEAESKGAQGSTNDPQELFRMVTKSIITGALAASRK